ncbi:MAG: UDP-N-acetylmuramate dehydrogenase [Desulfotignum sp.]|nr:UDP-N-acetylmuramate dehydrogenase [Desulfotignum sp.]
MKPYPGISKLLQTFDLATDVPMAPHTRLKVGGPADLLAQPGTRKDLIDLIKAARSASVPVTIVGGGCNLLVSDQGVRGLVVVTTQLKSGVRAETCPDKKVRLFMEAGERLSTVCSHAVRHGLTGLEFCAGIPGTIGGAVIMNAGTADQGIGGRIDSLDVLNLDTLDVYTLKKRDLVFSYRRLKLKNHLILGVTLTLSPGEPSQIRQTFNDILTRKQNTQPMDLPSAGCFFKNPDPDHPAGKLIEDAGLKGKTIRDAQVSPVHANYIVNLGHATCKDILTLKQHIQQQVWDRYSIVLETEVITTGDGMKNE